MKHTLLTLFLCTTLFSFGQANLIKDINLGNGSSSPTTSITFNNEAYFAANDVVHGKELWKTDGTEAGTVLVKDIYTGGKSAISNFNAYATTSLLYFYAVDGTSSYLYKTDGSTSGTVQIKEFTTAITFHTSLNNEVIFTTNGKIWKSDGTEAGTIKIADKNPAQIITMGNKIYFGDNELWESDGTAAGTKLLKDISSTGVSIPRDFFLINNNTLLFIAHTLANGNEFWKTDGTEAGTVLVKDVISGGNGLATRINKVQLNNEVYFEQSGTLWKTDGTEAGTVEVINNLSSIKILSAVNNKVLVIAYDSSTQKQVVWVTDGTAANTSSFNPDYLEFGHNSEYGVAGNNLFFQGRSATEGYELWKTDGTLSGTNLVKDIHPQADDNNIENISDFNGKALFVASDGNWRGKELYISDGSEAGTTLVKDINKEGNNSSSPANYFQFGNKLLFSADNGENGRELWVIENEVASLVKDINTGAFYSNPSSFVELNGTVYFQATTLEKGKELWKTDGTAAGTTLVKDINTNEADGLVGRDIIVLNNKLYFFANDGVNGAELWESDGTEAGTKIMKNINPADASSMLTGEIHVFKNHLYFSANDNTNGFELWKSDGTESGTNLFYDAHSSSSGSPQDFIEFKDGLHFRANSASGLNMFRTDGSNTFRITDKGYSYMTVAGDYLYFQSTYSSGGELWATQNGVSVYQVKDIRPGSGGRNGSFPSLLTNHNGTLFFVANDGTNGTELWKSDGTNSGTTMVKNIGDGDDSVYITQLISFDDKLVFGGGISSSSQEVWISDGTENGTKNLQEINPSIERFNSGSRPQNFFVSDNMLYFSANDGTTGSELWGLEKSALSTKTENINDAVSLNLYPNPTSDFVNLNIDNQQIKSVQLFNILGKQVLNITNKVDGIKQLNVSQLPAGMYLLQANTETGSITTKFVKN